MFRDALVPFAERQKIIMEQTNIIIDKNLVTEAERVLENIGLDITTVTKIMLKKIINEGNINFLMTKANTTKPTSTKSTDSTISKMTKSKAINLLKNEGIEFYGITTFASKNSSAYNYWANPESSVLDTQWNLILNDWINQEIHLFIIPKNSLDTASIVFRADKKNQIDLQIMYDDKLFTDNRSKISFARYLVKTIKY